MSSASTLCILYYPASVVSHPYDARLTCGLEVFRRMLLSLLSQGFNGSLQVGFGNDLGWTNSSEHSSFQIFYRFGPL